jgi:IS30 family transposase
MSHYHHLSTEEREKILVLLTAGKSQGSIARELGRDKSTLSRELSRNKKPKEEYSAVVAQKKYLNRRKKCRRRKLLEKEAFKEKVRRLFLEEQWSPEQIAQRLRHEESEEQISYNTIYRGIYAGIFDTPEQRRSQGNRGAIRKLRHRGKTRHRKGSTETRGKIVISHRIEERPQEAENRTEIGHWEADTVLGKLGGPCLVTMADRASRYLLAEKIEKRSSEPLKDKMITMLRRLPKERVKSITPDMGIEFAKHADVTEALGGVPFYFPAPHSPWQRGTNENTNGLLREYFPKSFDFSSCPDVQIALYIQKLNLRPRKCLLWLSPSEVFFKNVLHLT